MTKHPVASAFVIAVVIVVALAIVVPFSTQEAPWALTLFVLMFPFIWFFAWLVTNAGAWLKDKMERPGGDEAE